MTSWFMRSLSFLYFSWIFFSSGWRCAMRCIEWNCLKVSGSRQARTMIVSAMIDQPHWIPMLSWKNFRIASKKSISGWSGLVAKSGNGLMDVGVAPEEGLVGHGVIAAVAEGIAAQQSPRGEDGAPEDAIAPDRLHGVFGAAGVVLAARSQEW